MSATALDFKILEYKIQRRREGKEYTAYLLLCSISYISLYELAEKQNTPEYYIGGRNGAEMSPG